MSASREECLVAEAIAGDGAALERLLLLHYASIARHVTARLPADLRDVLSVEDVLQETFMHVFRDIDRFEPRSAGSFVAWVKAVADHRIQDLVKGLTRQKRGGGRVRVRARGGDHPSSMIDLAEWLSADDPTPSRLVARDEADRVIQIALAGLPPDYREVIRWRYFEGRSVEETAQLMGNTPGAVRGLLDRAKQRLRAALGSSSQYLSGG
jgi:RNA polymerase sigma-70 factor (ECF subfamily)